MEPTVTYDANVRKVKLKHWPVVIQVTEEIDVEMADSFVADLGRAQNTGQAFVPVDIHSPGGDVYSLMAMVNAIRASRIPIYTICRGFAASAAAALFMCGRRRFMAPEARLMVHTVSQYVHGSYKAADAQADAKEVKKLNQRVSQIMAESIGKPLDFFDRMLKRKQNTDWYMGLEEAMRYGIATSSELPVIVTRIRVETALERFGGGAMPDDPPPPPPVPMLADAPSSKKRRGGGGSKKKRRRNRIVKVPPNGDDDDEDEEEDDDRTEETSSGESSSEEGDEDDDDDDNEEDEASTHRGSSAPEAPKPADAPAPAGGGAPAAAPVPLEEPRHRSKKAPRKGRGQGRAIKKRKKAALGGGVATAHSQRAWRP